MRDTCHKIRLRLFVTLALMVSMAGIGFAHTRSIKLPDAGIMLWLADGGSLADICSTTKNGSWSGGCDACRLTGSANVPPPSALPGRTALAAPLSLQIRTQTRRTARNWLTAPQVRAPPSA